VGQYWAASTLRSPSLWRAEDEELISPGPRWTNRKDATKPGLPAVLIKESTQLPIRQRRTRTIIGMPMPLYPVPVGDSRFCVDRVEIKTGLTSIAHPRYRPFLVCHAPVKVMAFTTPETFDMVGMHAAKEPLPMAGSVKPAHVRARHRPSPLSSASVVHVGLLSRR
jgi:hypothetical protein